MREFQTVVDTGIYLLSSSSYAKNPDTSAVVTSTTTMTYDPVTLGQVKTTVSPRGNVQGENPLNYTSIMTYGVGALAGMLTAVRDPNGNVTQYDYDSVGRKTKTIDALGVALADEVNHRWTFTYDKEDRLIQQTQPPPIPPASPLTTTYQYDNVGNRIVVKDARPQFTEYRYDQRNLLKHVIESPDAWGADPYTTRPGTVYTTTYGYDAIGKQTVITRADGLADQRKVEQRYDGLGRLRQEIQYPETPTTSTTLINTFFYDKNSNQVRWEQPADGADPVRPITTTFDALNRPTAITYDPAISTPSIGYGYDKNSNRTTMVDAQGTTVYGFDELNRVTAIAMPIASGRAIDADTATVTYRYDADGNRTRLTFPPAAGMIATATVTVTYGYDPKGRMTSLAEGGRTTTFGYAQDDQPTSRVSFNGITTTMRYDNARRLIALSNVRSQSQVPCGGTPQAMTTTISSYVYTLDAIGNRTQVDATQKPPDDEDCGSIVYATQTYTLDRLSRITAASPGLAATEVTTTTYDAVGNRESVQRTGQATPVTWDYDKADRVEGSAEIGGAYIYTNRGNVRFRSKDDNDAGLGFDYDLANRITRTSTSGNATLATYTYDGDGLRRGKDLCCDESDDITASFRYTVDYATGNPLVLDDGHTSFIWAGSTLLYALPWDGRWGQNTTPWDQADKPETGPFVAIADGQGSITTWVGQGSGSTARLKWVQQTDIFGQRVPGSAALSGGLEHLLSMGYTGQQHDPESSLIYLRARYLDPASGRFMSRDTFGGYAYDPQSQNRYDYASGNPASRKDPSGHADDWADAASGTDADYGGIIGPCSKGDPLKNQGDGCGGGGKPGDTGGCKGCGLTLTGPYAAGSILLSKALTEVIAPIVRFGQRSIRPIFSEDGFFAGRRISEIVSMLKAGTLSPDQLPIFVVNYQGAWYTLNNRSLYVLRAAGMLPTKIYDATKNPAAMDAIIDRIGKAARKGITFGPDFIPPVRPG